MIGGASNKFDLGDHVYESYLLKETIDKIILTKTVLDYASRAEPGDDMWKCRGSARVYVETRASRHSLWKINASTLYCTEVLWCWFLSIFCL